MTLSIPTPCAQRWADMTPVRTDCRYCATCERQITDFSTKTDAEILAHLRRSGGKVCGHFRPDQLGRPLVAARSNLRRGGLTAAAASVAAVLAAQQPGTSSVPPQPVEQSPPATERQVFTEKKVAKDSVRTISGKVVDVTTGEPLIGATVCVEGTKLGAVAQLDGTFQLQLPLDLVQKGVIELIFTYTGYEKQTLTLPQISVWEDLSILPIKMATDAEFDLRNILGGIEVYNYLEPLPKTPLKARISHFFQKIF
jgi:hypothetical protein